MQRPKLQVKCHKISNYTAGLESGFTYVEVIITLVLTSILLPALFFCISQLEISFGKLITQSQLQSEFCYFSLFVDKELKLAKDIKNITNGIVFKLNGEYILYELKSNQIIRKVSKSKLSSTRGSKNCNLKFKGHIIVLANVKHFNAKIEADNVVLNIKLNKKLKNQANSLELTKYIARSK